MPPKISSAEWEVMNVVWAHHPATAPEVFAALPAGNEWAQKTVNTFLTRLVEKGVLKATKEANVNVYAPLLRREQCVAQESRHFMQRVFQGACLEPQRLSDCGGRELAAFGVLMLVTLWLGLYPLPVLTVAKWAVAPVVDLSYSGEEAPP